ncbi:MAG: FAD-dependent oxidoreductase, partial [Oscillospiraceae bacterium]|nr:FAD-dependent oxidoreductase [Oscillospiraceae bacterium]
MEKKFIEVRDSVPVVCETDVLVIGGGVAGIAAALAARRNGAKVTLLEKGIVLGGLATLGHVCVFLAIDDGAGNKIYGGLTEELLHLTFKYGPSDLPPEWKRGVWHVENPSGRYRTTFNIPAAVIAFDEIMETEGVDVVFDTVFSEPIMDGDVCRGVVAENKSGRTAYMAKVVIDASGDADVFARAGAECVDGGSPVTHWTYEASFEKMREGIEAGDILKAFNL